MQIHIVEIIFSFRLYLNNLHNNLIGANNKKGILKPNASTIISTNS